MDIFKELIKALTPLLKQRGFSKKGNSFYLEVDKNYGIVNFQKSRDSTNEIIFFTVNFGVYSNFLARLLGCINTVKPEVEQCHWQSRVGTFMPGSPDYWWKAKISDDLISIVASTMEIIQSIVVPEIIKRVSDEDLINCWMYEKYAGTTEICRFKYLTTLLNAKGDFKTLNRVVETFMQQAKGKPNAAIALEHLKEIEAFKGGEL